jgi:RNA polymerase sigma-70 factor (ECF subfamily)
MQNEIADLFHAYATPVYRICQRIVRNRQVALDLRQDVFLKILKNYSSFKGDSSVQTWVFRVTMNHCMDYLRLRRRYGMVVSEDQVTYSAEPMVSCEAEVILLREDLRRFLDFCPPITRQIVQLHFIEGFSHQEIGGLLGLRRNIVTRRIRKFTEGAKNYSPALGESIS